MRLGVAAMGLVAILVATVGTAGAAKQGTKRAQATARPSVNTVIMFAADGMRPDLVEQVRGREAPCRR